MSDETGVLPSTSPNDSPSTQKKSKNSKRVRLTLEEREARKRLEEKKKRIGRIDEERGRGTRLTRAAASRNAEGEEENDKDGEKDTSEEEEHAYVETARKLPQSELDDLSLSPSSSSSNEEQSKIDAHCARVVEFGEKLQTENPGTFSSYLTDEKRTALTSRYRSIQSTKVTPWLIANFPDPSQLPSNFKALLIQFVFSQDPSFNAKAHLENTIDDFMLSNGVTPQFQTNTTLHKPQSKRPIKIDDLRKASSTNSAHSTSDFMCKKPIPEDILGDMHDQLSDSLRLFMNGSAQYPKSFEASALEWNLQEKVLFPLLEQIMSFFGEPRASGPHAGKFNINCAAAMSDQLLLANSGQYMTNSQVLPTLASQYAFESGMMCSAVSGIFGALSNCFRQEPKSIFVEAVKLYSLKPINGEGAVTLLHRVLEQVKQVTGVTHNFIEGENPLVHDKVLLLLYFTILSQVRFEKASDQTHTTTLCATYFHDQTQYTVHSLTLELKRLQRNNILCDGPVQVLKPVKPKANPAEDSGSAYSILPSTHSTPSTQTKKGLFLSGLVPTNSINSKPEGEHGQKQWNDFMIKAQAAATRVYGVNQCDSLFQKVVSPWDSSTTVRRIVSMVGENLKQFLTSLKEHVQSASPEQRAEAEDDVKLLKYASMVSSNKLRKAEDNKFGPGVSIAPISSNTATTYSTVIPPILSSPPQHDARRDMMPVGTPERSVKLTDAQLQDIAERTARIQLSLSAETRFQGADSIFSPSWKDGTTPVASGWEE
jgi:hypothetical protein